MDTGDPFPLFLSSRKAKRPFALSVSFDFAQDIRKRPFALSLSFDFAQDIRKRPFALSLSFDFAQDIRKRPFALSLSKGELSPNGLCEQHWLRGYLEKICLLNYGLISTFCNAKFAIWNDPSTYFQEG